MLRHVFARIPSTSNARKANERAAVDGTLVATTADDTIAAVDAMTAVQGSHKLSAEVVAALLAGKDLPEAEFARLCAQEREVLARDAAVTAFLEIFVVRNVQQRLRPDAPRRRLRRERVTCGCGS